MKQSQRVVVAVVVAASAVAGAGAMLASNLGEAEAAPVEAWERLFPGYGSAKIYAMADDGAVDGQELRLGYFRAHATPEDVTRFYAAYWKSQGLLVDGSSSPNGAHLAAMDTRDSVMRAVSIKREGDHVVAFCSIMPLGKTRPNPEPIPVPAGAELRDEVTLDGVTTLTYVAEDPLEAHRKAVTDAFTTRGWALQTDRTRDVVHGITLEFKKGRQIAMATLAREEHDRAVAVQIHASEEREDSAP